MLDYKVIEYGDQIQRLIIMFHGYGSNKNDLISLVPEINKNCKNTAFISVSAPDKLKVSSEESARQWFSLDSREPKYLLQGLERVANTIIDFINCMLKKYDLNYEHLGLLGFSQGSVLILYLVLANLINPKIVLAFSGFIFEGAWRKANNNITKILLLHGKDDEVIPFNNVALTAQILQDQGLDVQLHISSNLGHAFVHAAHLRF